MLLSSQHNMKISKPEELRSFFVQYGDKSIFLNLRIAIEIMVTIAVSIASCERSFSKLKLVISYFRASMGQKQTQRSCSTDCRKRRKKKKQKKKIASVKARNVQLLFSVEP